jgi:hypothetical protein
MYLCLLLLLLLQLPSAPSDMPPDPGIYFRQAAKWLGLKTAQVSGTDTKGLGAYIQTGGFTSLQMDVECLGPRSLTRIPVPKPVFYVRGIGLPGDALIVRFDKKKNSRNVRAILSDSNSANKAGFTKNSIRRVDTAIFPDKSFSITPQEELKPGEYLLTFGKVNNSFDFGIDP